MPTIKEYSQQVAAPGPISQRQRTADDFGAAESKALTQLGQSGMKVADALYKRETQKELSDLNAKLSQAQADNAIEFENLVRSTEPGDKKVFEQFQKDAQDRLNKAGAEISTNGARDYFSRTSARIMSQLQTSSAATQADLDGEKAVLDYTSARDSLTAGVTIDPSTLENSRQLHADGLQNLVDSGLLPAREAAKLKASGEKDLVKSALRGWIKLDPNFAREKIKSGQYDSQLGGDLKLQLLGEVKQQERANVIEQERLLRQQERILQQEQEQTQNDFLAQLEKGELTSNEILESNLEAFGSGSKEQFLRMIDVANKAEKPMQNNSGTYMTLFDRIHLPYGDPQKITDESELNQYLGRGLNMTGLKQLRAEVSGSKTEKGRSEAEMRKQLMNVAKSALTKSNPMLNIADPEGDERLLMFKQFEAEQIALKRKNKEPIAPLYDPNSKEYIGKYLENYRRTPQEILKAQMERLRAKPSTSLTDSLNGQDEKAPPQRREGESISDYLNRMKAGPGKANAEGAQ